MMDCASYMPMHELQWFPRLSEAFTRSYCRVGNPRCGLPAESAFGGLTLIATTLAARQTLPAGPMTP